MLVLALICMNFCSCSCVPRCLQWTLVLAVAFFQCFSAVWTLLRVIAFLSLWLDSCVCARASQYLYVLLYLSISMDSIVLVSVRI